MKTDWKYYTKNYNFQPENDNRYDYKVNFICNFRRKETMTDN